MRLELWPLAAGRKSEVRRIATAAIETMARERGDRFDREAALAELEDLLGGEFADIGDYYLTAGVEMVCEALRITPDRSLWRNDMPGPHAFERAGAETLRRPRDLLLRRISDE